MKINKQKQKLLAELREAKARHQYLKVIELTKKLRELDDAAVEAERVSYNQLAQESMTKQEISQFTADVVAMIVACDILQKYTMTVESHMRRFKNFQSPEVMKIKHISKSLGELVKTIDIVSATHPIQTKSGEIVTLSDHYMNMVDEVETQFFGLENVISNIVNKSINVTE